MKALVSAFNQEKALIGAFSVFVKTGCGTDGALHTTTLCPAQVRLVRGGVAGPTLQCVACVELACVLAALCLYNISLATLLALPYVPLAILATQRSTWTLPRIMLM